MIIKPTIWLNITHGRENADLARGVSRAPSSMWKMKLSGPSILMKEKMPVLPETASRAPSSMRRMKLSGSSILRKSWTPRQRKIKGRVTDECVVKRWRVYPKRKFVTGEENLWMGILLHSIAFHKQMYGGSVKRDSLWFCLTSKPAVFSIGSPQFWIIIMGTDIGGHSGHWKSVSIITLNMSFFIVNYLGLHFT